MFSDDSEDFLPIPLHIGHMLPNEKGIGPPALNLLADFCPILSYWQLMQTSNLVALYLIVQGMVQLSSYSRAEITSEYRALRSVEMIPEKILWAIIAPLTEPVGHYVYVQVYLHAYLSDQVVRE